MLRWTGGTRSRAEETRKHGGREGFFQRDVPPIPARAMGQGQGAPPVAPSPLADTTNMAVRELTPKQVQSSVDAQALRWAVRSPVSCDRVKKRQRLEQQQVQQPQHNDYHPFPFSSSSTFHHQQHPPHLGGLDQDLQLDVSPIPPAGDVSLNATAAVDLFPLRGSDASSTSFGFAADPLPFDPQEATRPFVSSNINSSFAGVGLGDAFPLRTPQPLHFHTGREIYHFLDEDRQQQWQQQQQYWHQQMQPQPPQWYEPVSKANTAATSSSSFYSHQPFAPTPPMNHHHHASSSSSSSSGWSNFTAPFAQPLVAPPFLSGPQAPLLNLRPAAPAPGPVPFLPSTRHYAQPPTHFPPQPFGEAQSSRLPEQQFGQQFGQHFFTPSA